VLKYLGSSLQLDILTFPLAIISIIISILAYLFRIRAISKFGVVEEPVSQPKVLNDDKKQKTRSGLKWGFLIFLIIIALFGSYFLVFSNQVEDVKGYTDLFLLDVNGTSENLPTNLTVGEQGKVLANVVNHEGSTMNYRLVVKYDNTTLYNYNFTLDHNQKWEKLVTFRSAFAGPKRDLQFVLYKNNDTNPYKIQELFIAVRNNSTL
jgi:uncharacterized membrane protein